MQQHSTLTSFVKRFSRKFLKRQIPDRLSLNYPDSCGYMRQKHWILAEMLGKKKGETGLSRYATLKKSQGCHRFRTQTSLTGLEIAPRAPSRRTPGSHWLSDPHTTTHPGPHPATHTTLRATTKKKFGVARSVAAGSKTKPPDFSGRFREKTKKSSKVLERRGMRTGQNGMFCGFKGTSDRRRQPEPSRQNNRPGHYKEFISRARLVSGPYRAGSRPPRADPVQEPSSTDAG